MKISFTKLFTKALLVALFFLATVSKMFAIVSPPATCNAAIGNPANGASHYIDISWSTVSGATVYQLRYSADSTIWLPLDSGTATTYSHNTGSTGNLPYYYQVRTIQGSNTSVWKNATPFPVYSACNNPALPQLSGATGAGMNLTLPAESPDTNTSYTTYSIYCSTTSQYVQANGTLGATAVFQTRSAWGTIAVNGLSPTTNYCFYAAAKNNNGDIRVAPGTGLISQAFNNNVLVQNGNSNQWYIPQYGTYSYGGQTYAYGCASQSAAPGYPHWTWTGSTGCSANGAIYYQGDANWGYEGCLVNSPGFNMSGKDSCVVTLNLTNNNNYAGDYLEFGMWVGNSSSNGTFLSSSATSINGVPGTNSIYFTQARSCAPITITFNLTGTGYSNTFCSLSINSYANEISYSSAGYYALIDDINLGESPVTSCLTTLTTVGIYEAENESGFSIYPNPAKDNLIIKSTAEIKNARIVIRDVLGREVYLEEPGNSSKGFSVQVPLTFSAGVYFVEVADVTGKWTGRFVKE